jgi:hypothetical protein
VIGVEHLARACGHDQQFQHFEDDPDREGRREMFLRKRCPTCGRKGNEKHNRLQAGGTVKKGQEVKRLLAGARFDMVRQAGGSWANSLAANGGGVEGSMGGAKGWSTSWPGSGSRPGGEVAGEG